MKNNKTKNTKRNETNIQHNKTETRMDKYQRERGNNGPTI